MLQLLGISKRYGTVQALRGADFELRPGEVHALLGENGAGKTTLMEIAYGLVRADDGEIRCRGERTMIRSPRDARAQGIGMVHQHFTSVPALTVRENLALARGPDRWKRMPARQGPDVLRRLREGLDLDARVEELSVGQKQRLEIVKALSTDARILLLDEPTAVLAPAEVDQVLAAIRAFARNDGAAVLITHKLVEVFAVADRVTVLRRGEVRLDGAPVEKQTVESLAEAMIGAESREQGAGSREQGAESTEHRGDRGAATVVEVGGLMVPPLGGRGPGVREASFEVRAGEIVGIAAIEGNGHRELLLALSGLLPAASGRLRVDGPLAVIPEDRNTEGLIPALTLAENVALGFGPGAPWIRGPWIDWPGVRRFTSRLLRDHDVRAPGPDVPASTLSGGNQQKLVLGRALAGAPRVLVAENPTRGLDVRATRALIGRLRKAARSGVAILFYSSDLDEVLDLADRVLVVTGGVVHPMEAGGSREEVGARMLGVKTQTPSRPDPPGAAGRRQAPSPTP